MKTLNIAQAVIAIIVIILVLLQDRSSGVGGAFGGDVGGFYQKRRGLEKIIFVSTIVAVIAFTAIAITSLVIGA